MKIEIGESLLLSWLRHVKNCQLVQTNWKPSISSWELADELELEELMSAVATYFKQNHDLDIFKNNSLMQLLQQAEIDVIGTSFGFDGAHELYAIDVAFHEAGLNYGDKDETAARVLKKIIRTVFVIRGFFNIKAGNVIFASPKINNAVYSVLQPLVDEVKGFFAERGYKFNIVLYCNESFNIKILEPVVSASTSVADTSELFMRSLQLYNMFALNSSSTNRSTRTVKTKMEKIEVQNHEGFVEMKIGMLVRTSLRRLSAENKISSDEIEKLTTYEYSKNVFDINYPFLKPIDRLSRIDLQRFVNDRPRYWSEVFVANGQEYFACQEWFDRNRPWFMKWLESFDGGSQWSTSSF